MSSFSRYFHLAPRTQLSLSPLPTSLTASPTVGWPQLPKIWFPTTYSSYSFLQLPTQQLHPSSKAKFCGVILLFVSYSMRTPHKFTSPTFKLYTKLTTCTTTTLDQIQIISPRNYFNSLQNDLPTSSLPHRVYSQYYHLPLSSVCLSTKCL